MFIHINTYHAKKYEKVKVKSLIVAFQIGVDHQDDMGAEEADPLANTNVPATTGSTSTKEQVAAVSHQHHQVQHPHHHHHHHHQQQPQQTLKLSQVRVEMTASSSAAPSSSMIPQEFSSPPPQPTVVTTAAVGTSINNDTVAVTGGRQGLYFICVVFNFSSGVISFLDMQEGIGD